MELLTEFGPVLRFDTINMELLTVSGSIL